LDRIEIEKRFFDLEVSQIFGISKIKKEKVEMKFGFRFFFLFGFFLFFFLVRPNPVLLLSKMIISSKAKTLCCY